ncbi:hypothetical protein X474_26700 [Dethiosulfatarculus sandiegensis]|uniref:Uncharacterized protein n=1 Tax=Dethiosulfatarculus sandiegensis TaxID=1429043 RepID=A0A0D2IY73_9BACT|nr:hypothetical protein X474_26700 [Dethiosulfatarculus sandiegensis]
MRFCSLPWGEVSWVQSLGFFMNRGFILPRPTQKEKPFQYRIGKTPKTFKQEKRLGRDLVPPLAAPQNNLAQFANFIKKISKRCPQACLRPPNITNTIKLFSPQCSKAEA